MTSEIKSYRDLEVWQKGIDLVQRVYGLAKLLPSEERFGLTSQMQRAAVSVPANIAEGCGRKHTQEFIRHLSIARGSLMELETHLAIALRLKFIDDDTLRETWGLAQEVGRLLNGLIRALEKKKGRTRDRKAD